MPAAFENDISNDPLRAESLQLRLPFRHEAEQAVAAWDADRRIVRGFHDGHPTRRAIRRAIPRHAEAVAAVKMIVHRRQRGVIDRITDAFVDGQNEALAFG